MKRRIIAINAILPFLMLITVILHASPVEAKNIFKTDDELLPLIQRAPSSDDSDDSVVYLLWGAVFKIDGVNVDNTYHYAAKILKDGVIDEFNHYEMIYDSSWQDVQVETARTIIKDGTIHDVPKAEIRYINIYPDLSEYKDIKKIYIPFPAVARDSIIEIKIKSKKRYKNIGLAGEFFSLPSGYNILKVKLEMEWSKNSSVMYKYKGFTEDEIRFTENGSRQKMVLEANNYIIPNTYESYRPPYKEIGPYFIFSPNKSWNSVYDGISELLSALLSRDPVISEKAKSIISEKDAQTFEEKIRVLYDYVTQNIRYLDLSFMFMAGYDADAASLVLKNKYADCKGMASLFISLLNAVDIPAYFAMIPPYAMGDIDTDVPANQFNHVIVAIQKAGDGYIFLDPTASFSGYPYLPYVDQGITTLILGKEKYELVKIPLVQPSENVNNIVIDIKIKDDGALECEQVEDMTGYNENAFRFFCSRTGENNIIDEIDKRISKTIPGCVVKGAEFSAYKDTSKPARIKTSYSIPRSCVKVDDLLILSLPVTNFIEPAMIAANRREYDFWMPFLYEAKIDIRISVPPGYMVKTLPKEVVVDLPYMYFKEKFIEQDGMIVGTMYFSIKKRVIPASGYDQVGYNQFRNAVKKTIEIQKESIVFAKEK